ncbi:MAG TPA: hypothetical protein VML95_02100 [Longimicrobiales bacterium]|nr:hypothetical protein [Longimicrobiales bacterium]
MEIVTWKIVVDAQLADLDAARDYLERENPARATPLLQMAAEQVDRSAPTDEDRALRGRHFELAAAARVAHDWSFRGHVDHALLAVEDALGEPAAVERHAARRATRTAAKEETARLEAAASAGGSAVEVANRILASARAPSAEPPRPSPSPKASSPPAPAPRSVPAPAVQEPPRPSRTGTRYPENPQAPGRALVRGEEVQALAAEKARALPSFRTDAEISSRRPLRARRGQA